MFLLGFRRKLTALMSAIQWFQIHHRITFATIQNSAVYLSGARVSIFPALVPRIICIKLASLWDFGYYITNLNGDRNNCLHYWATVCVGIRHAVFTECELYIMESSS